MAKTRRDGWRVVQMVIREEEYNLVIVPACEREGVSESSFLRKLCGLPIAETRVRKGRKMVRKRAVVNGTESVIEQEQIVSERTAQPAQDGGKKKTPDEQHDAPDQSKNGIIVHSREHQPLDLSDELKLIEDLVPGGSSRDRW